MVLALFIDGTPAACGRYPAARATEIVKVWSTYGSLAMEYAKEAVLRGAEMPFREGLALEADLNTMLQVSSDRAEGIAAFKERVFAPVAVL